MGMCLCVSQTGVVAEVAVVWGRRVGSASEVKEIARAEASKDSYSQKGDLSQIIHWRLDKEGI